MSSCSTGGCVMGGKFGWVLLAAVGAILAYQAFFRPSARHVAAEPGQRQAMQPFELRDINGKLFRLADHKGRVVMVNFWATWCPPCQNETPDLVNVANQFAAKGLSAVGISLDRGDPDKVQKFATEYKIPYPIIMPPEDSAVAQGIEAIPVTLLLDRQGKIAQRWVGAVDEETLRKAVEGLLAEEMPARPAK